ncbi:phenylacetate--CoA ligase [Desulfothermus okinawensis JCM 13304]
MGYRFLNEYSEDELREVQLQGLKNTIKHVYKGSEFYRKRLKEKGIGPDDIKSLDDLKYLPFTTADDLRENYPFPFLSVPMKDVIRIHASSGTTGKRKILAYTKNDVEVWKMMMARCFEIAGLTQEDRVQIAVGYGLWTAGVGFQLGCEHFGATALPIGPGNMEIHLQFLQDLKPTCICSTASMALLLSEEVKKMGLSPKDISLKKAIFGAEPHTPKMRQRIEQALGLEDSFDIPGMTELYGPGTGLECSAHSGIHYYADIFILEIINPETLEPVEDGQVGEMVVTTLKKEAAPLIRYRTRDLSRKIPGECPCGLRLPRHDKIMGRSDDMFIFRGVNIYPTQIAEILENIPEISSEYQIELYRKDGLDHMKLKVERGEGVTIDIDENLKKIISNRLRKKLLVRVEVEIFDLGKLPRTFAKSKRVIDNRD